MAIHEEPCYVADVTAPVALPHTLAAAREVVMLPLFADMTIEQQDFVLVGVAAFPNGIHYADYDTWNIGIGFTYKVFTLDLRYSDTNLSKGNCSAFTSAYNASGTNNVTTINPGGSGSNWCGAAGIAKLSFDLTAISNLK